MAGARKLSVFAVLMGLSFSLTALGQTTRPASGPASQPATAVVKKGKLTLDIQGEGTLQPAEAFEVRLKLKNYAGPLTVASAAAHLCNVKKGDVVLALETTQINWGLETAENELATARANLKKVEAEGELAIKGEALGLRIAEDGVKNSEAGLKWWDQVDGPQMLLSAELAVAQSKNSVDDQNDELEQLRKMYKSEELTNATADIVVKRALRRLELSCIGLKMYEQRQEKVKANEHAILRQKMVDAVELAAQQLASVKIAQASSAVSRKAALANARIAVEQAERKLGELKADQELMRVVSPADGVVVYSQLGEGWQGEVRGYRAGDKLTAGALVMRVMTPGKLVLEATVPEAQALWVEAGTKATVTPVALPSASCDATCNAPLAGARGTPPVMSFHVQMTLPAVDARLLPGMKASFRMQVGGKEETLLVSAAAVSAGKATVRKSDGTTESRAVTVGRSDGQSIEVRSGLSEGEQVILPGTK